MSNGTIAIVDDDAFMATALSRLLSAASYETRVFTSAEAYLAELGLIYIDCIVLDVNLTGMSGPELAQMLHQKGIGTPVVLITAYDTDKPKAYGENVITCLTKPFTYQSLFNAIHEGIQRTKV